MLRMRGARILTVLFGLATLVLAPLVSVMGPVAVAQAGTIPNYVLPGDQIPVIPPTIDPLNPITPIVLTPDPIMYNLIPDSPAVSGYITSGPNTFGLVQCKEADGSLFGTGCQGYVDKWFKHFLDPANAYPGTKAIIPT